MVNLAFIDNGVECKINANFSFKLSIKHKKSIRLSTKIDFTGKKHPGRPENGIILILRGLCFSKPFNIYLVRPWL